MAEAPKTEPAERGERRQDPAGAEERHRTHQGLEERMACTLGELLHRIVEGEEVLRAGDRGKGEE